LGAIVIHGRLTRQPELRFSPGGKPVATLGIAENDRRKNPHTGEYEDGEPSFHNAVAFGQMAEAIAEEDLPKGTLVVATGNMKMRKYTDKQGEEKTVWEVILDDFGVSLKWSKKPASSSRASGSHVDDPPF
jgi:single-strand DNA-binding protein